MRLILPHATIDKSSDEYAACVIRCAKAAALCYNVSIQDNIFKMEEFVAKRIKAGHTSVIEHAGFTAKFVVDRGITHELVRHRLASFTQISTRYANQTENGEDVSFVIPPAFQDTVPEGIYMFGEGTEKGQGLMNKITGEFLPLPPIEACFFSVLYFAELAYIELTKKDKNGKSLLPLEIARNMLPHATAATIYVTANMRQWRHMFDLRAKGTTGRPHPQMTEVMLPLMEEAKEKYPIFFKDL